MTSLGAKSVRKRSVVSAAGQKHSNDESCNNTQDKRTKGDFTGETASEKGTLILLTTCCPHSPFVKKKKGPLLEEGLWCPKELNTSEFMGPSKQKECVWRLGVCRGACNRPRHSFLLTDAGPRGESRLGKGEDRGSARLTSPAGYWRRRGAGGLWSQWVRRVNRSVELWGHMGVCTVFQKVSALFQVPDNAAVDLTWAAFPARCIRLFLLAGTQNLFCY